ncbi:hypothetical protein M3M39_06885 [Fructilactobacillus hinvesii]|uniref:Integral membrane protein n=1 Tax=Fructilactobacillus hinvesii TaxID=2940300 RepID=A0ABY5BRR8_9LACO|nr:hypothetical protein [Fructilactobacillus hinvesii]USS87819.1 hypothetical protein M3M39_06885 [Fructilactobacillus hinvesii]
MNKLKSILLLDCVLWFFSSIGALYGTYFSQSLYNICTVLSLVFLAIFLFLYPYQSKGSGKIKVVPLLIVFLVFSGVMVAIFQAHFDWLMGGELCLIVVILLTSWHTHRIGQKRQVARQRKPKR